MTSTGQDNAGINWLRSDVEKLRHEVNRLSNVVTRLEERSKQYRKREDRVWQVAARVISTAILAAIAGTISAWIMVQEKLNG